MNMLMKGKWEAIIVITFMIPCSAWAQFNCHAECEGKSSNCISFSNQSSVVDLKGGLTRLHDFISSANDGGVIKKEELQNMFGVPGLNDPCERGDTVFTSNSVSNAGGQWCLMTETISQDGLDPLRAAIALPSNFVGDVEFGGGYHEFSFASQVVVPVLYISNSVLQEDWGGDIKTIMLGRNKSIIETESGCIEFSY